MEPFRIAVTLERSRNATLSEALMRWEFHGRGEVVTIM